MESDGDSRMDDESFADIALSGFNGPAALALHSQEQLERILESRLDDEPGIEATPEFWQELRDRICKR